MRWLQFRDKLVGLDAVDESCDMSGITTDARRDIKLGDSSALMPLPSDGHAIDIAQMLFTMSTPQSN